jgi:DNA-binding transcriptional regulator YiaG
MQFHRPTNEVAVSKSTQKRTREEVRVYSGMSIRSLARLTHFAETRIRQWELDEKRKESKLDRMYDLLQGLIDTGAEP